MNPFGFSDERGRTAKLRRRSDGSVAFGFLVKSQSERLPAWLDKSIKLGRVKQGTLEAPTEVQVITGRWWAVNPDDWIIIHGNDVWLIEDIDLGHTHDEVK